MGIDWLLIAFGAWCFTVAVIGGLLGLVLGNIRLPLTLAVASSPIAGVGANIAISGITAGVAAFVHRGAGRIDRRIFWAMAPTSVIGVVVGARIAGELPGDALLVVIGGLLCWFGIDLLRRHPGADGAPGPQRPHLRLAGAGLVIGVLGGIVGLILGALRMPALLRAFPGRTAELVGTNLAIGCLLGLAGGLAHGFDQIDLKLVVVGALASAPGAVIGARLTGRLDERQLVRGIGVMLLVAGASTAARAFA
ncbi:MAG: putative sulfonate transporter [Thermoleophilia bacterium]|nr:putative sulfonate transporter [Thermoleophilia bacterium]